MYKNGLVASLKVNNKFLSESGDGEVHIPFLSEYSIFLKNMLDERALVGIKIDGRDILNGNKLIVGEKSALELDGFLNDDNIVKNKFRFIKRTQAIEEFRGIKPEDSLIEISFDFEKKKEYYFYHRYSPYVITTTLPNGWGTIYDNSTTQMSTSTIQNIGGISSTFTSSIQNTGITVEGNETYQSFGLGFMGNMKNEPATIVMKLHGFVTEKEPIYVRQKIQCKTCGQTNKSHFTFCSRCGTNIKV